MDNKIHIRKNIKGKKLKGKTLPVTSREGP
jgi:hypothetical protein